MVTLRSKSAPRKSKRLQEESTKIQKKKVEKVKKGLKTKKKAPAKRRRKNFDNYCEEVKEEPVTPPSSRRGSRSSSPIIIPHFGPVILKYVNGRKNKRKPSFKPKNNDWIKKSTKLEFVGPERRLFRANVQRRGHKKQREYILVDYLYKNSYKTKLPPKNLWLDEPDYEFFPMQNVKNNNNDDTTSTRTSTKPSKSTKQTVEKAKSPASRAEKPTKEAVKKPSKPSKSTKKTSSTSQTPKTPSKQRLPFISGPKTPKTPRVSARRDSSPEIISYPAFPSPPSEPRSPARAVGVPPPYHVPENPVYNLTSTPVNTLPKPKPFRPWPMLARKPILAGSASPRSIHSGTSSLDLFLRNRRPSGPNEQDLEDINEEEDFDNEVLMLSPRRDRIQSQPIPRATPRVSLNSYDRRLSFNSQPGRVLSMPPPASSGSPCPSVNSSTSGTSGPRRRPSKRWDDIFATRSPRKLQHSFSQPAISRSSSRSLHGDFMSQTANSQPLETSTVIHRPGHRSFTESQSSLNKSRRSLNEITIEDEDDMNDEAETIQIKRRSTSKKSKNVKSNAAIWDEAISQIKI